VPADVRDQLLQEYPWLTEEDLPGHVARRFGAGGRGSGGGRAGGGGHGGRRGGGHRAVPVPGDTEGGDDAVVVGEVDLSEVFGVGAAPGPVLAAGGADAVVVGEVAEELAAFRADHAPHLAEDLFFFTRILGGRWTVANRGVLADGIGGYCRGGCAREWCNMYSWPKQHASYYARYGIPGATHLASEYVRRSHYFLGIWLESEAEVFLYEQHHVDDYEESLEFVTWMLEQPIESVHFARASELRKLKPVNP
jgi:hypothetical protein